MAIFVLVVSFLAFTNTPLVVRTFSAIRGGLNVAMGPALKVISAPLDTLRGGFNGYINLIHTKKENNELKAKVDGLLIENQKLSELAKED